MYSYIIEFFFMFEVVRLYIQQGRESYRFVVRIVENMAEGGSGGGGGEARWSLCIGTM